MLAYATICFTTGESDIKFVQLLFRHGDRAPQSRFPGDPFDFERQWPNGPFALTPLGVAQQHALGRFLHKRYVEDLNFLPRNYTQKDVYYYSSAVRRCLRSAQANAAGFFPPIGRQQWNSSKTSKNDDELGGIWEPLPIHSVPTQLDFTFREARCPISWKLYGEAAKKAEPEFRRRYKDFFRVIEQGLNRSSIAFGYAHYIADTIVCQWSHELYLPWINETFFRNHVVPFVYHFDSIGMSHSHLLRLRVGRLVGVMFERFRQAAERSSMKSVVALPARRIVLYSAHDSQVIELTKAFDVADQVDSLPRYTTCVIVELYQNDSLGLFYKNLTEWGSPQKQIDQIASSAPHRLRWPACGGAWTCPRHDVERYMRTLLVHSDMEMRKECGLVKEENRRPRWLLGVLAGVAWLLLLGMGAVMAFLWYRHRHQEWDL